MEQFNIVFGIHCCEKPKYADRLKRVQEYIVPKLKTIPSCKVLMVVCREDAKEDHIDGDFLVLAMKDGYYSVPKKTERQIRYVFEHFKFNYLARIDDDIDIDIEKFLATHLIADVNGVILTNFNKSNYYQFLEKVKYDMTTLKHVPLDKNCKKIAGWKYVFSYSVVKSLCENFFYKGKELNDMIPLLDDMALSFAIHYYCPGVSYYLIPYRAKCCHTVFRHKIVKESNIEE